MIISYLESGGLLHGMYAQICLAENIDYVHWGSAIRIRVKKIHFQIMELESLVNFPKSYLCIKEQGSYVCSAIRFSLINLTQVQISIF